MDKVLKTTTNALPKHRQKINSDNTEKKTCNSLNSFYLLA